MSCNGLLLNRNKISKFEIGTKNEGQIKLKAFTEHKMNVTIKLNFIFWRKKKKRCGGGDASSTHIHTDDEARSFS